MTNAAQCCLYRGTWQTDQCKHGRQALARSLGVWKRDAGTKQYELSLGDNEFSGWNTRMESRVHNATLCT